MNEKLLEIMTTTMQILGNTTKREEAIDYSKRKLELAEKLYTKQSEEYCKNLEECVYFYLES